MRAACKVDTRKRKIVLRSKDWKETKRKEIDTLVTTVIGAKPKKAQSITKLQNLKKYMWIDLRGGSWLLFKEK